MKKKAQEEMIGFALIIVIIGVIILVFFSISLKNKSNIEESYTTDNFMQALLQHSTSCANSYEFDYLDIRRLATRCQLYPQRTCLGTETTYCDHLEQELRLLVGESWNLDDNSFYRGYNLEIFDLENQEQMLLIEEGNQTNNFKSSTQHLGDVDIILKIYT